MDGNGVPVLPLNVAIGFRSFVNGKPKFLKENKPHASGVMSDICVLRVPARILGEPILQFNDDNSDAFNQFYLYPSQTYMTSILWLSCIVSPLSASILTSSSTRSALGTLMLVTSVNVSATPSFTWSLSACVSWRLA